MTIKEAETLIKKHSNLIGTKVKGSIVSMLIVAPNNHEHIYELAENASNGINSSFILQNYSDFDAVVVYEFEKLRQEGSFSKTSLIELIDKMNR